jgi:hypothetical protein
VLLPALLAVLHLALQLSLLEPARYQDNKHAMHVSHNGSLFFAGNACEHASSSEDGAHTDHHQAA